MTKGVAGGDGQGQHMGVRGVSAGLLQATWAADLSTDYNVPGATTTTAPPGGFSRLGVCRGTQGSQGQGLACAEQPRHAPWS